MTTFDEALAEVDAAIMRRESGIDLAQEAAALADDLGAFIRGAWPIVEPGVEYQHNWHIDAKVEHLEAVSRGEIRRLQIWEPPSVMKSRTVSIFWPAWEWTNWPWLRYFTGSYEIGLSGRLTAKTRDLMLSRWYRARWGELWSFTKADERYYANDQGGTRLATAPTSTASGEHGHRLIIDDPLNAQALESLTDVKLDEANDWYDGTLSTRAADPRAHAEVIIMQRLHERDLAQHAVEFNREDWTILCLPMEYEAKHPFVWPDDPRTEEGELLWPTRFDRVEVETRTQKLGAYRAAGQMQQRPAAREGLLLKRAHWRYYDPNLSFYAQEVGKVFGPAEVAELRSQIGEFDMAVHSWDTSVKDRAHSDFVSGQVWGCIDAQRFLLRLYHERAGLSETCDAMVWLSQWAVSLWPDIAQFVVIEGQANGSDAADEIRSKVQGVIVADAKGTKQVRAGAAEPALVGHNCFLPGYSEPDGSTYDHRTPNAVQEFVEELSSFDLATHDDQVDAWSSMVNWTRGHAGAVTLSKPNAGQTTPPRFHRSRATRLRPGLRT